MSEYVDPWRRKGSLQPVLCSGARLYGFVLRADARALDDLAERHLRSPSGGNLDYRPLLGAPFVFVTFAHVGRLQPVDPVYSDLGWMDEMEVAFWVPMAYRTPEALFPKRWPLFLPYVFVDRATAMQQGREMYGFPKQMASFQSADEGTGLPAAGAGLADEADFTSARGGTERERVVRGFRRSDQEPGGLRVSAFGAPTFGPDTQWGSYPLIELIPPGLCGPLCTREDWKSHDDASRTLSRPLIGDGFDDLAASLFRGTIKLFPFQARTVFLKQVYGASASCEADYQAIVEVPFGIEGFDRGGTLEGDYRIRIAESETHPIVGDLGLLPEDPADPTLFKPVLSWWADLSFRLDRGETVWPRRHTALPSPRRKKKVAILGGGVGAMSTAFWLTHPDNPQAADLEVTVYQLGWRLGGKGASGRNAERGQRIEEHGLHVWFGYYYNALRMMGECYRELAGSEAGGHRLFDDSFVAQNQIVLGDLYDGAWRAMKMPFPPLPATDGQMDPGEYVRQICKWMLEAIEATPLINAIVPPLPEGGLADRVVDQFARLSDRISHLLHGSDPCTDARVDAPGIILDAVSRAARDSEDSWLASLLLSPVILKAIDWAGDLTFGTRGSLVGRMLDKLRQRTWLAIEDQMDRNPDARALWTTLDLAFATLRGMFDDDVFLRGFDPLDSETHVAWLERHGAAPDTVASPFVRSIGGSAFAFPRGETSGFNIGAGTVLRNTLRLLFGYEGAFIWKMKAGMGDIIFAPLYQVLRRRGVEFKFFHRVREIEPGADGNIARIRIGRQVELKGDAYEPLVSVKGRWCWPHRPLYDQLDDSDAAWLRHFQSLPEYEHVPLLESYWSPWDQSREEPVVLEKGRDFDEVVLGISLGALPSICSGLAAKDPRWQRMFDHVQTARTQAFQLWMNESADDLASTADGDVAGVVATAYSLPIDTWADLMQTADAEDRSASEQPRLIAYLCGVMPDDPNEPPHFSDPAYPATQIAKAYQTLSEVVREDARHYWPRAFDAGGFRYDLLLSPENPSATGEARLKEQYWIANIDPNERYVLSVAGSLEHRLRSDAGSAEGASGFDNLYLAGDWTRTGLNAGFVEAAVVSGMQAARAATGWPATIKGENDPKVTPT